jgi:hypothetical protein
LFEDSFVDPDGGREVEPGAFEVSVGDLTERFGVVQGRPFSAGR